MEQNINYIQTKMLPKSVVIIEPTNFKINKESLKDNSYMQILELEDKMIHQKVLEEHQNFKKQLKLSNVEVKVYKQYHENAFDSIFTCDWIGCIKNEDFPEGLLVIFPMKWPSRRLEKNYEIVEDLKKDYKHFEDLSYFEEQNLALESLGVLSIDFHNRVVYMNVSERCQLDPANKFIEILNKYTLNGKYKLRLVEGVDPVTHDVCFHTGLYLAFIDKAVFFCKDFIKDKEEQEKIIKEFVDGEFKYDVILLSYDETIKMCANVFEVGMKQSDRTALVMSKVSYEGYSQTNLEKIKKTYEIIVVDMDTINACAGGSLRCMSLQVY